MMVSREVCTQVIPCPSGMQRGRPSLWRSLRHALSSLSLIIPLIFFNCKCKANCDRNRGLINSKISYKKCIIKCIGDKKAFWPILISRFFFSFRGK